MKSPYFYIAIIFALIVINILSEVTNSIQGKTVTLLEKRVKSDNVQIADLKRQLFVEKSLNFVLSGVVKTSIAGYKGRKQGDCLVLDGFDEAINKKCKAMKPTTPTVPPEKVYYEGKTDGLLIFPFLAALSAFIAMGIINSNSQREVDQLKAHIHRDSIRLNAAAHVIFTECGTVTLCKTDTDKDCDIMIGGPEATKATR